MKKSLLILLVLAHVLPAICQAAEGGVRIKDLARIEGQRDSQLIGYGIVTGLAGTGDSQRSKATQQSIANMLGQFGLNVAIDQVQSRNAAVVMVSATLPSFSQPGDKVDVVVTSLGDARSLLGGSLVRTPLKGIDDRVRAIAQGAISVGGYKYDLNGNLVQKNHPTVGAIPSGANIEIGVMSRVVKADGELMLVLAGPDYTTAGRAADAINVRLGKNAARAIDASRVAVMVGDMDQGDLVNIISKIENTLVEPDQRARVVVNERTGTVVSGGGVRISKVTIAHSDLKVSINTDYYVSQPFFVGRAGAADISTQVVPSTRIQVTENQAENVTLTANNTVTDLVNALGKIKASTRDVISILQGIKAAGALHAELIIQ